MPAFDAAQPPSTHPAAAPQHGDDAARGLLDKIAAAVQKQSLEPILRSARGAAVQGNSVIFDLGDPPNEFLRRQLKDNLVVIAQAASQVLGRTIQVYVDNVPACAPPAGAAAPKSPLKQEDILERAKQEPAVRSFLDTFPGPVKAEKL
jgi:hypothetical protein